MDKKAQCTAAPNESHLEHYLDSLQLLCERCEGNNVAEQNGNFFVVISDLPLTFLQPVNDMFLCNTSAKK